MGAVGKAAFIRNLPDRARRILEQPRGLVKSQLEEMLGWRNPKAGNKISSQLSFGTTNGPGNGGRWNGATQVLLQNEQGLAHTHILNPEVRVSEWQLRMLRRAKSVNDGMVLDFERPVSPAMTF